MRISDWSSDVCSSDLPPPVRHGPGRRRSARRTPRRRHRRDHEGQPVTTLELTFDPYDYDFHEDPYPTYAHLRARAPVFHAQADDLWVVSRHEDVFAVLRDDASFSNRMGVSLDASAWNLDAHRVMSFLALDGQDRKSTRLNSSH